MKKINSLANLNIIVIVVAAFFIIALIIALIFFPLPSNKEVPVALPTTCAGYNGHVCGWNGLTYVNECELMRAGTTLYIYGACNSAVRCSKIESPVCGADGKTYPNPCVAQKLLKVGISKYGPC